VRSGSDGAYCGRIGLIGLEHAAAPARIEKIREWFAIDPHDCSPRKIISPHVQRTAAVDANLCQRDLLIAQVRKSAFIVPEILFALVGIVQVSLYELMERTLDH